MPGGNAPCMAETAWAVTPVAFAFEWHMASAKTSVEPAFLQDRKTLHFTKHPSVVSLDNCNSLPSSLCHRTDGHLYLRNTQRRYAHAQIVRKLGRFCNDVYLMH